MYVLIAFLIAIALFAMIAGYIRNKNIQKKIDRGELDKFPEPEEVDEECCGQHSICEKDSLLAAVSKEVVYYDDEELDQFIGYTPMITTIERPICFEISSIPCKTQMLLAG